MFYVALLLHLLVTEDGAYNDEGYILKSLVREAIINWFTGTQN